MTTADAIEGMTDAGEFEILATRVLRLIDDDCRYLEHVGVNAAGKTIASSVDGFCRVPDTDPPRYIMAAFTTARLESLERKWLLDRPSTLKTKNATTTDEGDLIKAARLAEAIRSDFPNVRFVLHLCSNKQPDEALISKSYERGRQLGIEVRILARSRLRDVLDTTPGGQWLRKEHLGIQAEKISPALLQELSGKSLQLYGKEFLNSPETFVATSSARDLATVINSPKSVLVVTGPSGTGKSVTCYQVLRGHLDMGSHGLWIPGEIAAHAASLEEAVFLTLRSLHPTIEPEAGGVALRLRASSRKFLLVIDDINRGSCPTESLRKVMAWGQPLTCDATNQPSESHTLVLPIWDQFWAGFDQQYQGTNWLARVPLMQMSEAEAIACLSSLLGPLAYHLSGPDSQQIVAALGYDPILIAMYAASAREQGKPDVLAIPQDVIARFVRMATAEGGASGTYLHNEYDSALANLATHLLSERDMYPPWEHVTRWLDTKDVSAIREMARHKKLCRVTDQDGENRFEFRHDRILEYYLVKALEPMIMDSEHHSNVLSDPYYASYVGRALASSRPEKELLAWMKQHTPLALIYALRFTNSTNPSASTIASVAKDWLASAFEDQLTPGSLLVTACRFLESMDSPHVLDVTQPVGSQRLVARARLANGDAAAGVIALSRPDWFPPAVSDRSLDAVLSRALHRHRQTLIEDCKRILQNATLTESERSGALVLAGFIGDPVLALPIRTAWESSRDRPNSLLPALWASSRCCVGDPSAVMDDMMKVWASLPGKDQGGGISERQEIADELRIAVQRGIHESVMRYLIAQARQDDALRSAIVATLEHLNHPTAMRFIIEEAAEIDQRVKKNASFSPWLMILRDHWDPTKEGRGKRLSTEVVEVLRACWESEGEEPQLRETAFGFWLSAVDDLGKLRSVPAEHPQFRSVLWRRAMLGDLSVVPIIKPLLTTDDRWFWVIRHVWTREFRDALDQALLNLEKKTPPDRSGGQSNTHYMLAELLRDIPAAEAQPLLTKHWRHLRNSPLFVQAALYLRTPEWIILAEEAMRDFPAQVDPFNHIGHFFGFFTTGLMDRLEQQHLEVLLPYLNRLDDNTLLSMAEFCERRGYREWGIIHLKPECDRRRAQLQKVTREKSEYIERIGRVHFPSDADLLEDLDWIEGLKENYYGHLYHWSEGFVRRQEDHGRWRRLLKEWLNRAPAIHRFRLFTDAVLEHGTREDLDILEGHGDLGNTSEIASLIANARFGVMRRSLH